MPSNLAERTVGLADYDQLSTALNFAAERKAHGEKIVNFGGGFPPDNLLETLAAPEIFSGLKIILTDPQKARLSLQYGESSGIKALREALAAYISRKGGLSVSADNILITNGLQEGIELASYALCDPGDIILVSNPTYPGALQAFSIQDNVQVWGLPSDNDGIITDGIKEALKIAQREGKKVKMTYCLNVGNPDTSVILTEKRAEEILELGQKHGFAVFQDDAYDGIIYDGSKTCPPLLYFDPNVIYGGTVSKGLAPGLRIGWVSAPSEIMPALRGLKTRRSLCGVPLIQALLAEYIKEGKYEENIPVIREEYEKRRNAMLSALTNYKEDITVRPVRAGMFVWAENNYGINTEQAAKIILHKHNVVILPGSACFAKRIIGEEVKNTWMRLNFTNTSPADMEKGASALCEGFREIKSSLSQF